MEGRQKRNQGLFDDVTSLQNKTALGISSIQLPYGIPPIFIRMIADGKETFIQPGRILC